MEYATEDGAGDQAVSVEQCQCPVGYTGTSCEVKQKQRYHWGFKLIQVEDKLTMLWQ